MTRKPKTATFNILGYEVTLTKDSCLNHEAACKNIFDNAPDALIQTMRALPENKFNEVIVSTMLKIQEQFGTLQELTK